MTTKTIWGYISNLKPVTIISSSGDFSVTAENDTGFYDITFNPGSFNAQPAIVGSVVSNSDEAPVFTVYSLGSNNSSFVAEIRDAHSGDRANRPFMFTATGPTDDD